MTSDFILFAARLDWFDMGLGLGSNRTGALIAMLILLCWLPLMLEVKRVGLPAGVIGTGILGYCLLLTQSRGALLALAVGFAALFLCRGIKLSFLTVTTLGAVVLAIVYYGISTGKADRYFLGTDDGSIQARFKLWEAGLSMLHDAPGGWGVGNSGNAFMQWYQPYYDHEEYFTLVNTHLTHLVEFSWWGRAFYLISICCILGFLYPIRRQPILALGLSIWLCFLCSAAFNPIDDLWQLWVLPLISLVAAAWVRQRRNDWSLKLPFVACFTTALILLTALYFIGGSGESGIQGGSDYVKIGEGDAHYTLYKPDVRILDYQYGHDIRKHRDDYASFETVYSDKKNLQPKRLILTGRNLGFPDDWAPESIHLINPDCEELNELLSRMNKSRVYLYAGRYMDWSKLQCIENAATKYKIPLTIHPGTGNYFEGWLNVVIKQP